MGGGGRLNRLLGLGKREPKVQTAQAIKDETKHEILTT